jgi:hypothetical protein
LEHLGLPGIRHLQSAIVNRWARPLPQAVLTNCE